MFNIAGSGVALPQRAVSYDELDALVGRPTGWT
jgi:hypothetical protein